jgi:hypothetical protein
MGPPFSYASANAATRHLADSRGARFGFIRFWAMRAIGEVSMMTVAGAFREEVAATAEDVV